MNIEKIPLERYILTEEEISRLPTDVKVISNHKDIDLIEIPKSKISSLPSGILEKVIEHYPDAKFVWEVAFLAGMFKSKSEARRMAQQGGLYLNDKKVDENRKFLPFDILENNVSILRKGKKNYLKLNFK